MDNSTQLAPYIQGQAHLIPLHPWNKQRVDKKGKVMKMGKIPLHGDWTKREYTSFDPLATMNKGFNVGHLLTEDDIIIDVDPRNFAEGVDSLEKLTEFLGMGDLREICPTVNTGGGGHHFYMLKPPNIIVKETVEEYPGIEFKTLGRQVVAAGSRHPNGVYYEWNESFAPEYHERPKCPGRLLKRLKRDAPSFQIGAGTLNEQELHDLIVQLPVEEFKDQDKWFKILCAAHHGTEGKGVDTFVEWSCKDSDYKDDEHIIKTRWASLGGKDLNITVNSLYKEVLAYGGTTDVTTAENDFAAEASDDDDDWDDDEKEGNNLKQSYRPGVAMSFAKKLTEVSTEDDVVIAIRSALQANTMEQTRCMTLIRKATGFSKSELKEVIMEIKEQIGEDFGRMLAEATLNKRFHDGKGLIFNSDGRFWTYNGKFWQPVTPEWIGSEILKQLDGMDDSIKGGIRETMAVNDALASIKFITASRNDGMRLREKPYPVINCQNGEVWLNKKGEPKLRKHNPKSRLLQVLSVDYTPGADCPMMKEALLRTFEAFDDRDDMIRHIFEIIGYVLHPEKRPAHWWLFTGPGGDGKTTILKIICALLGDAVQADNLDRYKTNGGDKHASAELVGKLLLYDDDLNSNMVLPDGVLKKLSEDGEMNANPKGTPGFKFFKCLTTMVLCNGAPRTKDMSRGFRRRAMVVPFNKAFHQGGAILDMADQIIKTELDGVLNEALIGLARMKQRENFKAPVSCAIAKDTWLNQSNSIALFLERKVDRNVDPEASVLMSQMFNEYIAFCLDYGFKHTETKQSIRITMEQMGVEFKYGPGNIAKFYGVALLDEGFDEFEGDEDW